MYILAVLCIPLLISLLLGPLLPSACFPLGAVGETAGVNLTFL